MVTVPDNDTKPSLFLQVSFCKRPRKKIPKQEFLLLALDILRRKSI